MSIFDTCIKNALILFDFVAQWGCGEQNAEITPSKPSAELHCASLPAIRRQGRWKSVNTVMGYIEAATRFEENASDQVLKKVQSLELNAAK